jgi:hypothetical protein
VLGKRKEPGLAAFFANLEKELLRLERELHDETWQPGGYKVLLARDPSREWSRPPPSATASVTTRSGP